jgi:hypothetical protein
MDLQGHPAGLGSSKKLLKLRTEALRHVFCDTSIKSYQDLWEVGGVVERAARRADSIARFSALQHLRESLKLRKVQTPVSGHADKGHLQVSDKIEECLGRIDTMVRADRQEQSRKALVEEGNPSSSSTNSSSTQVRQYVPILLIALWPRESTCDTVITVGKADVILSSFYVAFMHYEGFIKLFNLKPKPRPSTRTKPSSSTRTKPPALPSIPRKKH